MRAGWVRPDAFRLILTALMPENRLALEVSMATGLRIGDVLSLRTSQILRGQRTTVREEKTGKSRRVWFPKPLWERMVANAGWRWVFEGRTDRRKHRTRQAVFKDLRRVAALYRVDGARLRAHVSPHTARKVYAVAEYQRTGSLEHVRRLLNHENEATTMLYALADELERREHRAGTQAPHQKAPGKRP